MAKRLFAGLIVCAALGGCASPPDCSRSAERGERAADARRPLGEWIGDIRSSCTTVAEAAWAERLEAGCVALFGFHAGRTGMDRPTRCSAPAFDEAWSLGDLLGDMERERARIDSALDSETDEGARRRLRQRLLVIERDLPQLEALARMEGWLPPAEVPEGPAR